MTRRHIIRALAIAAMVAFTVIRTFVVENVFAQYGVNTWIFFAFDVSTAITYVIAIEQLIVGAWRKSMRWLPLLLWSLVALASFAIPYIYIFVASRTLPAGLGFGLIVVIVLLFVNATIMFARRMKSDKPK